jgi:hypothetical protein
MQTHAKCRERPFHGGSTGSNPVGDAKKTNHLAKIWQKSEGLKGFDKEIRTLTHRPSPLSFP